MDHLIPISSLIEELVLTKPESYLVHLWLSNRWISRSEVVSLPARKLYRSQGGHNKKEYWLTTEAYNRVVTKVKANFFKKEDQSKLF